MSSPTVMVAQDGVIVHEALEGPRAARIVAAVESIISQQNARLVSVILHYTANENGQDQCQVTYATVEGRGEMCWNPNLEEETRGFLRRSISTGSIVDAKATATMARPHKVLKRTSSLGTGIAMASASGAGGVAGEQQRRDPGADSGQEHGADWGDDDPTMDAALDAAMSAYEAEEAQRIADMADARRALATQREANLACAMAGVFNAVMEESADAGGLAVAPPGEGFVQGEPDDSTLLSEPPESQMVPVQLVNARLYNHRGQEIVTNGIFRNHVYGKLVPVWENGRYRGVSVYHLQGQFEHYILQDWMLVRRVAAHAGRILPIWEDVNFAGLGTADPLKWLDKLRVPILAGAASEIEDPDDLNFL